MKKLVLIIVMIAFTLTSCVDKKEASNSILNNDWKKEIALDNGEKWEANIETTKGVSDMIILLKENKETSLEAYLSLAEKLNKRNNILVKECTMVGPSHDNLHIFLYPLIEKINALLEVESASDAEKIVSSISENLDAYTTYFK
ncbi:hypothetical protein [Polaribacter uvawellassae]|uniref:hypothetical protein n=1 Tax=Polaribacter uvawellassae TaxID=3133495 RepID=UPI003219EF13